MDGSGIDRYQKLFLGREEAIRKINELAADRIPFIFFIDFNLKKGMVFTTDNPEYEGIHYEFGGNSNIEEARNSPAAKIDLQINPVSFSEYKSCFDRVYYHLKRGDTYLINLTFPTRIITAMKPEELYQASDARYKIFVPGHFICFSPETFVKFEEGRIKSFPMKGTIDSAVENAREKILADKKELYEHNTIVDLIRNDLSMVAEDVTVKRFRYVEEVTTCRKNLLQVSSEIEGRLFPGWRQRLGKVLFTLLPAGSVTGAPKKRTVEIIKETEPSDRNFYTGIFGRFDGENLDSAVMIRFIELTGQGYLYRSGGGITALSRPEDEYQEMIDKVYVPVI